MTDHDCSSHDILRSVICSNPGHVVSSLDKVLCVQAGLLVLDTTSQTIYFMQEKKLAMFKDIKSATLFLMRSRQGNDGEKTILVDHFLALKQDVFELRTMTEKVDTGESLRVKTVEEINDKNLGQTLKMKEDSGLCASRIMLEVTHDMLVNIASDIFEEETVDELDGEMLSYSPTPVSPNSLPASSETDCPDTCSDKEDFSNTCSDKEKLTENDSLDKLLQAKQSLISQIVELSRGIEESPPKSYQRRFCQSEQVESVSSEEGEWSPCGDTIENNFKTRVTLEQESLEDISSDDNLDCIPGKQRRFDGPHVEGMKRKRKRRNTRKVKSLQTSSSLNNTESILDAVSSDDNLDPCINIQ